MPRRDHDMRSLLLAIGVGDYNATGIIPYMTMAPAQVDADMPAIMLLTEALQKTMNEMGAQLEVTAELDVPTVVELKKLVGPNWLPMKWWEIVRRVANARDRGVALTPGARGRKQDPRREIVDDGVGAFGLPTIPTWGWLAGAGALWYWVFGGKERVSRARWKAAVRRGARGGR